MMDVIRSAVSTRFGQALSLLAVAVVAFSLALQTAMACGALGLLASSNHDRHSAPASASTHDHGQTAAPTGADLRLAACAASACCLPILPEGDLTGAPVLGGGAICRPGAERQPARHAPSLDPPPPRSVLT